MTPPRYALIGAAGYIAPRHLKAIQETGGTLVAALDKADNVGVLDRFFPETQFFTEFERFDRFLDKQRRAGQGIDYLTVCSPNYLHDAHVRYGLRAGAHVICEKPLVLNPWNLDAIVALEAETQRQVNCILQLRLHPALIALKQEIVAREAAAPGTTYEVKLTYVTPRGPWYHTSWKGDVAKSGGIATNIGIHFFDLLIWLFGPPRGPHAHVLHEATRTTSAGTLDLPRARVTWRLSIAGTKPFREITVDGRAIEFSDGFTDLHTRSYAEILAGRGFRAEETRAAVQLAHDLRQ